MAVKSKAHTDQSLASKSEKKSPVFSSKTVNMEKETEKPKLVIVSDKKSAFTDIVRPSTSHETQNGKSVNSSKGSKSSILKKESSLKLKKRKSVIYDSDIEDDGLDFGSENVSKNKKLKQSVSVPCGKTDFLKKKLSRQTTHAGDITSGVLPLIIESDDDVNGDLNEANCVNGDNSVLGCAKGGYSLTEDDKAAAVCLIDSDSDFE